MKNKLVLIAASAIVSGCVSSIVDGESLRTSNTTYEPKADSASIELFFAGQEPSGEVEIIGKVNARAHVLEKGMAELKEQARNLGADAITNIDYERRFSADYMQDLFFINGDAVIFK